MIKLFTTVGIAMAVLSPCHAAGGGDQDKSKVVTTTLSAIRDTPESYKGVCVSFPVQFSSLGRVENPFFTRFVATDYANLWCWADEQAIWRKEQFDDVFAFLFVNKESKILDGVMRLARYERIKVTGVVRNTFQGQPWIEVTSYESLPGKAGSATLSHMYRGETYMKQRKWSRAISELSLAPAQGVPAAVRAAAHRDLGICHLRLGERESAHRHLSMAAALNGDEQAVQLLARVGAASKGLDRQVKPQTVHDRPLWEAFAEEGVRRRPPSQPKAVPGR